MLVFFHQFVLVRVTTHEQPSRTMRIIFLNECAVGDVGPWHCCGRIFQMVCQRCDLHSRALKLFLCDSVSIDAPLWSWKDLNEDVSQMKQELPRWLLGGQDGLVGVVGLHNYTWLQWRLWKQMQLSQNNLGRIVQPWWRDSGAGGGGGGVAVRPVCRLYLKGQHYVLWLREARADQMKRTCRRQRQRSVKERAKPPTQKHVDETEQQKEKSKNVYPWSCILSHCTPTASPLIERKLQSELSLYFC